MRMENHQATNVLFANHNQYVRHVYKDTTYWKTTQNARSFQRIVVK